ncbi:MAG: hypothetical protein L3K16_04180 [Thermoplasmata archaeon]|nr:hypothetical protein [Thermoplasmata archaeon]
MRPWIVGIGVAFVLVGGGALAALVVLPPPSNTQLVTSEDSGVPTPPSATESFTLASTATSHGTLSVHWSSTAPLAVRLSSEGCGGGSPGCPSTLRSWPANSSGSYEFTGALARQYSLTWTTPPKVSANFSAASSVTWDVDTPTSLGQVVAEVASGILALVGGIGVFLGLFLRGDFRSPPPIVSRNADDAALVTGDPTDPRTGPSGAGSGPPRRGPPSPPA